MEVEVEEVLILMEEDQALLMEEEEGVDLLEDEVVLQVAVPGEANHQIVAAHPHMEVAEEEEAVHMEVAAAHMEVEEEEVLVETEVEEVDKETILIRMLVIK